MATGGSVAPSLSEPDAAATWPRFAPGDGDDTTCERHEDVNTNGRKRLVVTSCEQTPIETSMG
jgi:hypothetical protein